MYLGHGCEGVDPTYDLESWGRSGEGYVVSRKGSDRGEGGPEIERRTSGDWCFDVKCMMEVS